MSLLYRYKPEKDRILAGITRSMARMGMTPNIVSMIGLALSIVAGVSAAGGHIYLGIIIFFIAACLDTLDGSLARTMGACTETGRYLDSICDRLGETAFIVGAVIGGAPELAILSPIGSLVLMGARVRAHRQGRRSDRSFFSRPERLVMTLVGLLAPYPLGSFVFAVSFGLSIICSITVLYPGQSAIGSTAGPGLEARSL